MRYNHQGLGGVLYQKVYQEQPAGPVVGAQHESVRNPSTYPATETSGTRGLSTNKQESNSQHRIERP